MVVEDEAFALQGYEDALQRRQEIKEVLPVVEQPFRDGDLFAESPQSAELLRQRDQRIQRQRILRAIALRAAVTSTSAGRRSVRRSPTPARTTARANSCLEATSGTAPPPFGWGSA